jgi:hypothetical protein
MNRAARRHAAGLLIAAVISLGLGIGFGTGFYVVPRYELAASSDACVGERGVVKAETIWFFRPGLEAPFLSSDGGMLIRYKKEGLALFQRIARVMGYRDRVRGRAFLHLPYLRLLYRLSAEGRNPVKCDEAF